MKRLILISFLMLIATSFNFLYAQAPQGNRQGGFNNNLPDRFRSEKVSFLTDKLQLTPNEAQKFWPLYNELERERFEAQNLRRQMEHRVQSSAGALSDREAMQLTRDFSGSMQKEGELQVKYNEEFLKVIPPAKVLLLYKSENDFRVYMLQKYGGNIRTRQQ